MALHSGSHVDFSKHYRTDGETAESIDQARTCGKARVFNLGDVEPSHPITVADLEAADPGIETEIVLIRTGWTDRAWGEFPRYYVDSPFCTPEAAQWLVDTGSKAIGFDCFPEEAAKRTDYAAEEFVIHRTIGDGGAVLMQQLTNLSRLPADRAVDFVGAFLKFSGAEGVPARFLAILDDGPA